MSYSEAKGWSDERLRSACEEFDARINRVELDVLLAIRDGYDEIDAAVAATGLTAGQVRHARSVLAAQGLAEPAR